MALNAYIACDICGRDVHLSCNKTMSMTRAISIAKLYGWRTVVHENNISQTDFYCPDCSEEEAINGKTAKVSSRGIHRT